MSEGRPGGWRRRARRSNQGEQRGSRVMPSHSRNMPEQEHSIKARSHELFVEDPPLTPGGATKPFKVYLRETPARPLSPGIRALFWVLGAIVGVLFLMAVWRVAHRHTRTPSPEAAPTETGMSRDSAPCPSPGLRRA